MKRLIVLTWWFWVFAPSSSSVIGPFSTEKSCQKARTTVQADLLGTTTQLSSCLDIDGA